MSGELRVLLSYWYGRKANLHTMYRTLFPDGDYPDTFCDSGAFSAKTQGAAVDLDEYAAFVHRHASLFTTVANLDVIGNPEATYANQKRLEGLGLSPLPVFHAGEPFEWLHRYLDEGYKYIALGGLVGYSPARQMPWLVRCFRIAGERAVFHGFGLTSWQALSALPWHSVDSSTWVDCFRWGDVSLFDAKTRKWVKVTWASQRDVYRYGDLIRSYGVDPVVVLGPLSQRRSLAVAALAIGSWRRAEETMRGRHGRLRLYLVGMPWSAVAASSSLATIAGAYDAYLKEPIAA